MIIDYINGAKTDKVFGYKRVQDELNSRLSKNISLNKIEYPPSKNILIQSFNILIYYPTKVFFLSKHKNLKVLTSPDIAYLMNFLKFKKKIIFCYDIITYHKLKDFSKFRRFFIKLNYKGLVKADHIITISKYSKNDIAKTLNYPEKNISIVYPCVDLKKYYPKRDKEILSKYNISKDKKIIMYVGSEEPRQNVDKILLALKILVKKYPEIIFIKVGNPQWINGREKLLELIKKLGLEKNVLFTNYVQESDLPKFYNAADVFIYPCEYAGWGLPPMEALACKTPVIVSNTTSIPEAVGNGGVYVTPTDHKAIAINIEKLLENKKFREEKINGGFLHVKKFSWDIEAKKLENIYKKINKSTEK